MSAKNNYCHVCACRLDEDSDFCPACGTRIENEGSYRGYYEKAYGKAYMGTGNGPRSHDYHSPKHKWVALALCVFTICGHKFYDGRVGMGLLYLFTGGLFCVGWIADIVRIATGPEVYFVDED